MLNKIRFIVKGIAGNVEHEYKLGLGPCGKVVTGLAGQCDGSFLIITQHHADGTYKEFTYPAHLIQSKVTTEHGHD